MDLDKFWQEVDAIRPLWRPFIAAVVAVGATIWAVIQFAYGTRLSSKDAEIALLTRKMGNKADDAPGAEVPFVDSVLRTQFYGDERIPTETYVKNISSWYAYWNNTVSLDMRDKDGKQVEHLRLPRSYLLVVTFERPTKFRQAIVSFSAPGFPQYQINQASQRHVIVSIQGDIPAGSLELHLQK